MAKIKRLDLEFLSSDQIKEYFLIKDISKHISPIKEYLEDGKVEHIGLRANRVDKLLSEIIVNRFIKGTL